MTNLLSNRERVPPSWGRPLTETDYVTLEASWINRELADQAMLRRVDDPEGREVVGQKGNRNCAGLLIPYYWPGEPSPFAYRVRRDNPEVEQGKDGKVRLVRKYLAAPGDRNRLYIPPGVTPEQLCDKSIPIVLVEGEKKALALWRLANYEVELPRFIPIALAGVWNWRGKVGRTGGPNGEWQDVHGPIPDLSRIDWLGRTVFVLFDANVHRNDNVKWARRGITKELATRNGEVRLVDLPEDCGVNGVDDLLAIWGPARILELFASAEPASAQGKEPKRAQALIELAAEAKLFHTPEGDAYAQVPIGAHHEIWPLHSKDFRRWLTRKFYEARGKPPGTALPEAIAVLEAKAQFGSPEYSLALRVAGYEDRIYVDLCDQHRQIVEITPQGWRLVSDPPVRFRRARGMQPLPIPAGGGSFALLRRFLNLGDENDWVLCATWLVAAFRPKGPYPILILQGEQGSAKSTAAKLLRRIVDPSVAPLRTPPKDDRDLLIAANNSWVLACDNLSGIPAWLSDALCRLATGGGFSTRALFTDTEEVFFQAARPMILNGIDHLAERPDLAERALLLSLPAIEEDQRRDEAQIDADFERELPLIFGALLTAVSGALARLPGTKLERKPRMADFALWATAAELTLGFQPGAFLQAYGGNRAEAIRETLDADPLGSAIVALMDSLADQEEPERWEGTCKDLHQKLEAFVDDATKKSPSWPKSPRAVAGRLRRLAVVLRESGIGITSPSKSARGRRVLTITRKAGLPTATTATIATQTSADAENKPLAIDDSGGGWGDGVAVEEALEDESPPTSIHSNALKEQEKPSDVAEVAKVAIVSGPVPGTGVPDDEGNDVYTCANCGRVEWYWDGHAWMCPRCGAPAPGQQSSGIDVERFEL
ncbi:MAG TPA: DUF3854 domain-containing protein [Bryobacteraceae bacterium]|nr:DUF3854 domain-containing protein [Bryobacteraceae bacterium]